MTSLVAGPMAKAIAQPATSGTALIDTFGRVATGVADLANAE